eukprot:7784653-Ditylum_brightwellii.AAC.1
MFFASHAPIEHLFNNHYYCGQWCKRKREVAKLKEDEIANSTDNDKNIIYRYRQRDVNLYKIMREAYVIFQTKEVLEQSHCPFDMQKNKGMNLTAARYAPKTRCYSTTMLLQIRISIAVGLQNA